MANMFKNLLNNLNLTGDDDGYDDDDMYNEDDNNNIDNRYDEPANVETPKKKSARKRNAEPDYSDNMEEDEKPAKQPKKGYGKVVHMKTVAGNNGGVKMELRVIRPKAYDDSREIADTLSEGMPVVLNLEGLNADLAQRILDFTSGSVYAMNGNLQKVTSYIFVITPSMVAISGNFDEMLDGTIDLSGNTKYVFRD